MISARLTDGTTTVNLNDGDPFEIMEFDLGYGDPSEREISGSVRLLVNGNSPSMPMAGAVSHIRTSVQSVQKLLQQGINYWRNDKGAAITDSIGNIVYLEVKIESSDDYYRTPIVAARYSLPAETTWSLSVGCSQVEYVIDFMRRNWWEGPEAQLGLATSIVTETTNYVDVYNPKPYVNDTTPSITFDETGGQYFIKDAGNRLDRFITGSVVYARNTGQDADYSVLASAAGQLEVFQSVTDGASSDNGYFLGSEETHYVKIDKGDVSGDLPSACKIMFKNTDADSLTDLWIGHWFDDPAGACPTVYEAEDGSYDYVDDLISTDVPPPSEGYLIEYNETFPGTTPNELIVIDWTLTTASLGYYRARYFKAILKLFDNSGNPNNYNYQLRIRRNSTIIWEGPIVRYGGYPKGTTTGDSVPLARDLGTFRIPPQYKIIPSMQNLKLELVFTPYDTTVGSVPGLKIDYLMLLPVDGFRYLQSVAGVAQNSIIYDEGYQGYAYVITSGGKGEGDVIGYGNQIMLQPGTDQRIYFFQGPDIFRTGQVKIYYRPRRLSI